MGEICLRCDGLAGPCMVGFGAAWCYCMGVLVLHVKPVFSVFVLLLLF